MSNHYEEIANRILKMHETADQVREELEKTNELYQGYHPKMQAIQNANAEELEKIIYDIGWPTVDKVGEVASYAAWLILKQAIGKPSLQRRSLPLLVEMTKNHQIMPFEVAVLYDRICFFEMRPQKYGTQFEFDENGNLNPWTIENMDKVDEYRSEVGLPPLNQTIIKMNEIARNTNEKPTIPYKDRLIEREVWAKKVGWIE